MDIAEGVLTNDAINKKPRGRPKTDGNKGNLPISGVVDNPSDNINTVEVLIQNTASFKKMIKSYLSDKTGTQYITFNFLSDKFEISSMNHFKNARMIIRYNPYKVSTYYIKNEMSPVVLTSDLNFFNKLDKNHIGIKFYIKSASPHILGIDLVFMNGAVTSKEISILRDDDYSMQDGEQEGDDHTLKANFPIALIKSFVSGTSADKNGNNTCQIEGYGNDYIRISDSNNLTTVIKGNDVHIYNTDDYLGISIYIKLINLFISSAISNKVHMYLDEYMKLILKSIADNELCSFTVYISHKDQEGN